MADNDQRFTVDIDVTGGNQFADFLEKVAKPLETLQTKLNATADSFVKFDKALPSAAKLGALSRLGTIFESLNKLPGEQVLARRAKGLAQIGKALDTLSFYSSGSTATNIAQIGPSLAKLSGALKNLDPATAKKTVTALTDLNKLSGMSGVNTAKLEATGKAIKDFGLDIAAVDSKDASNLNKFSVGLKNITKLLTTDLPDDTKLKKFSTFGKEISKALKPLAQLGELKIGAGIQQTVAGLSTLVSTITNMDVSKLGNVKLTKLKEISADLAGILAVFATIPRPKSLNMIGGAISGIVGAINVVSTLDVSATQLNSKWQAIANVGKYVATALKQFDGVKRPENLAFVGTAVKGIIEAANAVNEKKVDAGLISAKWAKLIIAAQYVAMAMKRFSGIKLPPGIEHMGAVIKEVISLVGYAQRATVSTGDIVKNWIKIELAAMVISRALRQFDKIKKPENIQAAGFAVRAVAEVLRDIGEVPKNLVSGLRFWKDSVAKDLGGIFRRIANALKVTNKLDPTKVKAAAEAIRAISALISAMPTATAELEGGTVTTWARLDEFFKEVAKGFKELAKIKIPTNLGNLAVGLKELAAMGGDFSMLEKALSGKSLRGGAFGIFQGLVDSVVNTVTFVPRKINELAVKLIPGLGKIESLLGNMFSGGATTGGKLLSGAFTLGKSIAAKIADGIRSGIGLIVSALGKIPSAFLSVLSSARNFGNQLAGHFNTAGQSLLQISRTAMMVGQQLLNSPFSLNRVLKSQALSTVADYESIMKQIEVLGGVSGSQLGTVNDFLLQLGADSVFSAGQAADAFLELSKSGLSVADSMSALPEIMNLAAAGNMQIVDSASLVINAVGAYGKSFDDTKAIVDSFAAAANVSTAEVADLATGFSYAAPSAAAFGVSMDTLNAALALASDRGLDASKAGTGLRAVFNQFLAPTDKAVAAMDELGLSFYDTQGNARDFVEILNDITRVLGEGTIDTGFDPFNEESTNAIIDAIAGSANAGTALLSLMDLTEDGTLTLEEYIAAMEDSASAAEIGASLMDTFKGSVEALKGSVETLLIKALTPLINHFLRPLVDLGTDVVNFFSSLPSPILTVATALFGVVSAGITLVGSLSILTGIITGPLGAALLGMGGSLFAILNPLKLISMFAIGGIFSGAFMATALALSPVLVAIGAAFYDIYRAVRSAAVAPHIEAMRDSVSRLQEAVTSLYRPFKRVSGFILGFLFGGTDSGAAGTKRTQDAVIGIVDTITGFVDSMYDAVMDLRDIGYGFSQFFDILDALSTGGGALGTIEDRWNRLFSFLKGNSIAEMLIGKDFSQASMVKFFLDFEQGLIRLRNVIQTVAGAFTEFFTSILAGENIGKAFGVLFRDIGDAVDFKSIINTVVNGLVNAASTLGNAALLGVGELINWALPDNTDFSGIISAIQTGLTTAFAGAGVAFDLATSGIVDVRAGWLEYFMANKDAISANIKTGLSYVLLNLGNLGIDLVDILGIPYFDAAAAKTKWAELTTSIADALGSTIADAIGIVLGTDDEGIAAAFDTLKTSVSGFINSILIAAEPLTDTLAGNVSVLFGSLSEAFASLKNLDTGRMVELLTKLAEGPVMDGLKVVGAVFGILFEVNIAAISGIISMVPSMVNLINALLNGDWSGAGVAIRGMFSAFVDGIIEMVNSIDETLLNKAEEAIYNVMGLLPEVVRKSIGAQEEFIAAGKKIAERGNKEAYEATIAQWGSSNFIADEILRQLEETPQIMESARADAMVAGFYADWSAAWENAGLAVPVGTEVGKAISALESYLPQQDIAGLVGALVASFELDDATARELAGSLFSVFEGYTTENFDGFRSAGGVAAEAFADGFVQAPWEQWRPTAFEDFTPVDYESLIAAVPSDPTVLSAPIDNAANAMQRFREADVAASAADLDAFNLAAAEVARSGIENILGDEAGLAIATNIKNIVDEAERFDEVDWSTVSATMLENVPVITEQAGIIETAFTELQTAIATTLSAMQINLPAIKSLFITNFDGILAKELEVENSLRSFLGGILAARMMVATQLPAIRQIWVTEFQLMTNAVLTLLTPLTQVGMAVGGLSLGGMSVNTGTFPEKRAKGGPVMANKLYEVGENNRSELLNISGRSYLIPGADGSVTPAQATGARSGSVPGVQAAGQMVAGFGGMEDPQQSMVAILRHLEIMTAQIEINTSARTIPDWFNKYWNEYVEGMWVKTVEKLWKELEAIASAVGNAVSSAAGGGGGGSYASAAASGGGGGAMGSGTGAAPTSRSAAGQASWWGNVSPEHPFGDKIHIPTGPVTPEWQVGGPGGYIGLTTTNPNLQHTYGGGYMPQVGGSYAYGTDRLSKAAARVGENGKPELFSLGGRNYLIPGAGGGKIVPLRELAAGPGMQNVRGMGYNNSGGTVSIVEGDIHVTVQATTGANAAEIAAQARSQVSAAQEQYRQRVHTTLRAAGRV